MFGVHDDGLVTFSKLYLFLKILISYHVSTIQTVWWTLSRQYGGLKSWVSPVLQDLNSQWLLKMSTSTCFQHLNSTQSSTPTTLIAILVTGTTFLLITWAQISAHPETLPCPPPHVRPVPTLVNSSSTVPLASVPTFPFLLPLLTQDFIKSAPHY